MFGEKWPYTGRPGSLKHLQHEAVVHVTEAQVYNMLDGAMVASVVYHLSSAFLPLFPADEDVFETPGSSQSVAAGLLRVRIRNRLAYWKTGETIKTTAAAE